jgi:predicted nucleic acid-binding Zn ribbon protein
MFVVILDMTTNSAAMDYSRTRNLNFLIAFMQILLDVAVVVLAVAAREVRHHRWAPLVVPRGVEVGVEVALVMVAGAWHRSWPGGIILRNATQRRTRTLMTRQLVQIKLVLSLVAMLRCRILRRLLGNA